MKSVHRYLACDFGAESGRVVCGSFDGSKLAMDEIHRFPTTTIERTGHLHWDVERLFSQIQQGISNAAEKHPDEIRSIAVDTWGVDYALIDRRGELMEFPFCYRDHRTDGKVEEVFQIIPEAELYSRTGIQRMQLNTIYQLAAEKESGRLNEAAKLLFMPDFFAFLLSGSAVQERTIASTSQLLDPATRDWDYELLDRLELPRHLFSKPVLAATTLGELRRETAEAVGITPFKVVAVGGHDTASAVASVPLTSPDAAWLSSGTWSLLGVEQPEPIRSPVAAEANFTNEVAVDGKIRFLKNIAGLWLLQECRRHWEKEGMLFNYQQLVTMAEKAEAFVALIDVDGPQFEKPGDMVRKIVASAGNQPLSDEPGAVARAIFESLAIRYRIALDQLREITGKRIDCLHVVGGGSKNMLLNQFTANALGIAVCAGPGEATAIGNVLGQMLADGQLASWDEGRQLVAESFPTEVFEPQEVEAWDAARQRYTQLYMT